MTTPHRPYNPARYLVGGFIAVILTGSFILSLPVSYHGEGIAYIDALFTATSAVCVTGLVVVDTGTFYSPFGQAVIMLLIFIGSLGFMTMATLIFIFLGRRITLRDRLVVREALNQETMTELVPLVKAVVRMAVIFVLAGAALLSLRLIPGLGLRRGIFFALFHAVSAFGNAGFDLFGGFDSLTRFPADYLVNGTILALFICGGLGFPVIFDVIKCVRRRCRPSLHTRLVLIITGLLLVLGTALVLALESGNPGTMAALPFGAKIFTAFFTAATPRTAGFSVLDTGALLHPTILGLMALMFIGASPASTGGGIKTTTAGIVFISLIALVRGRQEPVLFRRRIPMNQILKAMAISGAAASLVFVTTFLLALFEEKEFISLFFESVSAFGTVGLSRGITPDLAWPSKVALIVTMFGGRVGPLTLLVALARQKREEGLLYPEEKLLIG
jgi:trk system potassium uptake protein TrkH